MEQQDARSGKLVVVAHCILNQNARVSGLAAYPAMVDEVVDVLRKHQVGFLQLACPEVTYAGARRPAKDRGEYDQPRYRRHCKRIALSAARQIEEFAKGGVGILALVGIRGSPSCSVSNAGEATGILVEELESALLERGRRVPAYAIDVCDVAAGVEWLKGLLRQG